MDFSVNATTQQYLADLSQTQARLQRAQLQVSSGLRLQQVSDDPSAIAAIFRAKTAIAASGQTISNLNNVSTELSAADSALQTSISAVDSALALAAQGANSTQTAQDRLILADQVSAIQQTLVSASQTTANGLYIFSGDADSQPAYQLDPNQPDGVKQLLTAGATRLIQDGAGTSIAVARTAQDVFDVRDASGNPAAGNVFHAVQSLLTALRNNDEAGISQAADLVRAAGDHLNSSLAFYGAAEKRVADATELAQKFTVQEEGQLGNLQDADLARAALELTQAQTQQQATLSVAANVQKAPNLFTYLA